MIPGAVDYKSVETPPEYKCGKCGRTGVKLWRLYSVFLDHQELTCCDCSGDKEGVDTTFVTQEGQIRRKYEGIDLGMSDQIGNLIPAVPTQEGDTFWGYTAVPVAGCTWWRQLPLR